MDIKASSRLSHGLQWKYFPQTLYLSLFKNMIQIVEFSCLRGITKGTLLGEKINFSAVFRLPIEKFSSNFTPRTFHVCYENDIRLVAVDG
jgi:hypothetical protein